MRPLRRLYDGLTVKAEDSRMTCDGCSEGKMDVAVGAGNRAIGPQSDHLEG